jgi:DNA-directed RNA polymerase subunit N (RpoN/RPB10)
MIVSPVCVSCGGALGQYAGVFRKIRADRSEKKMGNRLPSYVQAESSLNISMGDILDDLNVKASCCRLHLLTETPLRDTY